MKIVVVEDEKMVAKRLQMFCEQILGEKLISIKHFCSLDDAQEYLGQHKLDLLFLDLNLNHENGFELLKNKLAAGFQTIVVSANTDRALEAFEYGVLDFIAKPFKKDRVAQAIERLTTKNNLLGQSKHLVINNYKRLELIETTQINYIQAAGHYSEIHLFSGDIHLHEKNLAQLLKILPDRFDRVHKSYVLNLDSVKFLHKQSGGQYQLELNDGAMLPLGRSRYTKIKEQLNK